LEAIRSFICYPNLDVKMLSSHGGLTAAIDGATHQATEDICNMSVLPNMHVLAPADTVSAAACVDIALATRGPVFTRLMRDPLYDMYDGSETFELGGSKTVRTGTDVTIVSYGDILFEAVKAAELLADQGIQAEVIDAYSIKPYDREAVLRSVSKTGAIVVAENHQLKNGFGYEIAHLLMRTQPIPFEALGIDDAFGESGDYYKLLDKFGISASHIAAAAERVVKAK